jgi:hypothetical protein
LGVRRRLAETVVVLKLSGSVLPSFSSALDTPLVRNVETARPKA